MGHHQCRTTSIIELALYFALYVRVKQWPWYLHSFHEHFIVAWAFVALRDIYFPLDNCGEQQLVYTIRVIAHSTLHKPQPLLYQPFESHCQKDLEYSEWSTKLIEVNPKYIHLIDQILSYEDNLNYIQLPYEDNHPSSWIP